MNNRHYRKSLVLRQSWEIEPEWHTSECQCEHHSQEIHIAQEDAKLCSDMHARNE